MMDGKSLADLVDVDGNELSLWEKNDDWGRVVQFVWAHPDDTCPALDEKAARELAAALIRFADGGGQ